MEACLVKRYPARGRLEQAVAAIRALRSRACPSCAAGGERPAEERADHEAVNRRAERMLSDYGNSIFRLAYSYLHNRSDAEEVLREAYDFEETVR